MTLLGRPVQLVGAPAATRRTSPGAVRGQTVLSDEGTVSLHSEASLERLNELLAAGGEPRLPADRFRANVVRRRLPGARRGRGVHLRAGDVTLAFARLDERCAVTTVDQRTRGAARPGAAAHTGDVPPPRRGRGGLRGLRRRDRPGHPAPRRPGRAAPGGRSTTGQWRSARARRHAGPSTRGARHAPATPAGRSPSQARSPLTAALVAGQHAGGPRRRRRHACAAAPAPARPTGRSRSVPRTAGSRSRPRWTATAAARPGAGGWSTTAPLSASGTRRTRGPSGSFEVRRTTVDSRGTDAFVFRARNDRTGELCRGNVNF